MNKQVRKSSAAVPLCIVAVVLLTLSSCRTDNEQQSSPDSLPTSTEATTTSPTSGPTESTQSALTTGPSQPQHSDTSLETPAPHGSGVPNSNSSESSGNNGPRKSSYPTETSDPLESSRPSIEGPSARAPMVRPSFEINAKTGKLRKRTEVPWDAWPAHAFAEVENLDVAPPAKLHKKYGDAIKNVAYDAALAVATVQAGLPDLYAARSGKEHGYYAPIRPLITADLWKQVDVLISQGITGKSFAIGSFAPQTNRSGQWAVLNGITYNSNGQTFVEFRGTPRISSVGDDVLVTFSVMVTAHATPVNLQYDASYSAAMRFEDNQWLMNGWNNTVTSGVRKTSATPHIPR